MPALRVRLASVSLALFTPVPPGHAVRKQVPVFTVTAPKAGDPPHWARYARGVVWALADEGIGVGGFEAVFASDVPQGSGLSSSAAFEVAAIAEKELKIILRDPVGVFLLVHRDIEQYLRKRSHDRSQLGELLIFSLHHREHLQR